MQHFEMIIHLECLRMNYSIKKMLSTNKTIIPTL